MRGISLAVIGAALLVGSTAQAADPTVKCQQSKLKAQGKLKNCLDKNAAGVLGGKDDKSADCREKFTAALQKADEKATAAATSCRYIDNGDGTVSDLDTGLVWEKKDDLGGIHDKDNTYSWSSGAPHGPDGTVFTTFLYSLNGATSSDGTGTVTACFTGDCDWRLPTIQELQGIVDLTAAGCDGGSPCIDPVFGSTQTYYWSATTLAGSPFDAWYVLFTGGFVSNGGKTNFTHARAVRGGL